MRAAFDGPLILNSDYDGPRAQAALNEGQADAIAFGRPFIANPDLPARIVGGTLYARLGDWPFALMLAACLGLIAVERRARRGRSRRSAG